MINLRQCLENFHRLGTSVSYRHLNFDSKYNIKMGIYALLLLFIVTFFTVGLGCQNRQTTENTFQQPSTVNAKKQGWEGFVVSATKRLSRSVLDAWAAAPGRPLLLNLIFKMSYDWNMTCSIHQIEAERLVSSIGVSYSQTWYILIFWVLWKDLTSLLEKIPCLLALSSFE